MNKWINGKSILICMAMWELCNWTFVPQMQILCISSREAIHQTKWKIEGKKKRHWCHVKLLHYTIHSRRIASEATTSTVSIARVCRLISKCTRVYRVYYMQCVQSIYRWIECVGSHTMILSEYNFANGNQAMKFYCFFSSSSHSGHEKWLTYRRKSYISNSNHFLALSQFILMAMIRIRFR